MIFVTLGTPHQPFPRAVLDTSELRAAAASAPPRAERRPLVAGPLHRAVRAALGG